LLKLQAVAEKIATSFRRCFYFVAAACRMLLLRLLCIPGTMHQRCCTEWHTTSSRLHY